MVYICDYSLMDLIYVKLIVKGSFFFYLVKILFK